MEYFDEILEKDDEVISSLVIGTTVPGFTRNERI